MYKVAMLLAESLNRWDVFSACQNMPLSPAPGRWLK